MLCTFLRELQAIKSERRHLFALFQSPIGLMGEGSVICLLSFDRQSD